MPFTDEVLGNIDNYYNEDEHTATLSGSVQLQNLLRIMVAYGRAFDDNKREFASAGLAVVNQSMSLSYMFSVPYLEDSLQHQAVNLSMTVAM